VLRQIKPTYWKEGGIIGAVAAGAFMTYFAGGFCAMADGNRSCTGAMIGGALIGSGVGFALGGLIGGAFPKGPRSSADLR
jgi:hypothetical protein